MNGVVAIPYYAWVHRGEGEMAMTKRQTQRVVFQPATYWGMQRGINQIVEAVRPTLGPLPRFVAIENTAGRGKTPELLDSGGVIVRRVRACTGMAACSLGR